MITDTYVQLFVAALIAMVFLLCIAGAMLQGQLDNLRMLYSELRYMYDDRMQTIGRLQQELRVANQALVDLNKRQRDNKLSAYKEWSESDDD